VRADESPWVDERELALWHPAELGAHVDFATDLVEDQGTVAVRDAVHLRAHEWVGVRETACAPQRVDATERARAHKNERKARLRASTKYSNRLHVHVNTATQTQTQMQPARAKTVADNVFMTPREHSDSKRKRNRKRNQHARKQQPPACSWHHVNTVTQNAKRKRKHKRNQHARKQQPAACSWHHVNTLTQNAKRKHERNRGTRVTIP
jgi:hypothetical protein